MIENWRKLLVEKETRTDHAKTRNGKYSFEKDFRGLVFELDIMISRCPGAYSSRAPLLPGIVSACLSVYVLP